MKHTIIECVTSAGKVLMEHFGKVSEVSRKQDQSNVVTEADIASERCIIEILQRVYPSHNILAEETGFTRKASEFTWVIDPLDGTSNFAAGIPWFGVLIALLRENTPILGAMYLPCSETFYIAEEGRGVYRDGTRIQMTTEAELRNILCAYGLDSSPDEAVTRKQTELLAKLVNRVRNVRSTNSLVDFCYTLEGRFGGAINHSCKIWDIAPAELMFREAGGMLSDLQGQPLHFDLGANYDKNYAVVGASQALHPQLLAMIKRDCL